MTKKHFLVSMVVMLAIAFIATAVYAACPGVIKMDDKAYKKHKKGIVEFHHKKHEEEYAKQYPDLYKNGCGECHHDKDNKPLTNLTCDSKVQKCIDCHKIPGERPKGKKAPKLSKKERLAYHAEALHYNCKGCHKKFNKKYKPKKAPTTCSKCHPKKKKK
jgi:cytochrome c553